MKKPEYLIALTVIAGSVILVIAMSLAIGDLRWPGSEKQLKVLFESVNGIVVNSDVKYAGAPVGRVTEIKVLSREDRRLIEAETGHKAKKSALETLPGAPEPAPLAILVTLSIIPSLELGDDVEVTMQADTMLSPKFIALLPGKLSSPELDWNTTLVGTQPIGLEDLSKPAVETMEKAQELLAQLTPAAAQLRGITSKINQALPNVIVSLDALLDDGDDLINNLNDPVVQQRIRTLLGSLSVVSQNLKVVSSNAKALTLTLAETPWRLLWGGPTNPPPPEEEVLHSNQPIPVRNVIEVNAPEKMRPANPTRENSSSKRR